ncbi:MAG: hypothetical protein ACOY42_03300 [Pseudomonadota bacterium]
MTAAHLELLVEEPSMKIEAARAIGAQVDPDRSSSRSFRAFRDAVAEACA